MTIQEEIRELRKGLTLLISECYSKDGSACKLHDVFQPQKFINKLFPYLDSKGVVIQVKGELPQGQYHTYVYPTAGLDFKNGWEIGGASYRRIIKDAGYVAVEPLIVKHDKDNTE